MTLLTLMYAVLVIAIAISMLVVIATMLLSFHTVGNIFEKFVRQLLYRPMYNNHTLLWNASRIIGSTRDLSELSDKLSDELLSQTQATFLDLILIRNHSIVYVKHKGKTVATELDEKRITNLIYSVNETSEEHIVLSEEMYSSPEKKTMVHYGAHVLVVLSVADEPIGALFIGKKTTGALFTAEEMSALKIVGFEIALAINNALSYEEISRSKNTLEEEVEKAMDVAKSVNEQMYVKNVQLAETNKTLSLLRRIDDIILTTVTDTKQIAQRVADAIVGQTHIKSIRIMLVEKSSRSAVELSTAPYSIVQMAMEKFNKNIQGMPVSLRENSNLIIASINEKTANTTSNTYDIVRPYLTPAEAQSLQEMIGSVSYIIYPLIVRGEVLGAMSFGLTEQYRDLSDNQKDLISRLVGVMGIALDNSLLYQKIQEANVRLKQLDLLKDEFVSVASHELRTPMTAIKSYLWLALANRAGPLNDKLRFYLDRSYSSTNRLIKLVNDMLNVSRIESGRMSFDIQKVDTVKLVEDVISEVKPRVDELGIQIFVEAGSSDSTVETKTLTKGGKTPPLQPVLADPDKIKEIVINLIGNSLKFTPRGGKITISFERTDGKIVTHVTDTGEGIAEDDLPKLFQKFNLVKGSYQTNKQSSQGTGLGLYICREIMKEHGGDIWAASPGRGQGATFSFSLKVFNDKDYEEFQHLFRKDGLGIIHSEV